MTEEGSCGSRKISFRFLDFSERGGGGRYVARSTTREFVIEGEKKKNLPRIAANNVGSTTPYPNGQDFLDNSHIRKFYSRVERTNVAAPKDYVYTYIREIYIFDKNLLEKKCSKKQKKKRKRKKEKIKK